MIHNIQNDHTYSKSAKESKHLTVQHTYSVGQEYADDCSFGSTNNELIDEIDETVPEQLEEHNLFVNLDKTERTVAKRGASEDWKNTLLLGSKLGTVEDIKRRKGLASAAWEKYSVILTSKTFHYL